MDDFGGKLRQARERRGISLRQIAASTKISAAALEALERNDISKLPGGIFSRAFVRSYASEVGLDPEETVREFLARFDQEPPSAEAIAAVIPEQERTYQEQQRKAARTLGIAGVAVVIVVVVSFFVFRNRGKQLPPAHGVAALPGVSPAPQPASAHPAVDAGAPVAPPANATVPLKLDIHPTSECWVSLTVDGRKLFARNMKSGERESHTVAREAVVEIGDAGAFAYSVNGRPGKSIGDSGQVKTLKLTPATASEYVR